MAVEGRDDVARLHHLSRKSQNVPFFPSNPSIIRKREMLMAGPPELSQLPVHKRCGTRIRPIAFTVAQKLGY
jgi:hypothetical protein